VIDFLAIDRWSGTGRGWLNRTAPAAKLAAVAAIVAFLVAVREPAPLGALYALLLVCLLTSGLPVLAVLAISLVPVLMSLVFAVSRLGGGLELAVAVVLKGAITSLTMLLLVSTTPHVALLRLARRALPGPLADMLFLGYRAIFVVVGRALAAREALRLRGGAVPVVRRVQRGALVGALSVLRAVELAADQYAALRLRTPNGSHAATHRSDARPATTPKAQTTVGARAGEAPQTEPAVIIAGHVEVRYPDGRMVHVGAPPIEIKPGERVALLGANGSGKSTLLRIIIGLARPVSGEVRVFGKDPAVAFDLLRPHVGAVLQDVEAQLLAPTVREDLAYGLQGSGLTKEETRARVERIAAAFRLENALDRVPHYLSGGERRKVALAGALVTEPRLLVLDEPFAGLDPRSREELVELIGRAHAERELTLILATHEVDQLPRLVDTVVVLRQDGEVRAYGPVHDVLAMEDVLHECNVEPPVLGRLRLALQRRGMTVPPEAADDVEALANLLAKP